MIDHNFKPGEIVFEPYPPHVPGELRAGLPSGVRAAHVPSGTVSIKTLERSQWRNAQAALRELAEKVDAAP